MKMIKKWMCFVLLLAMLTSLPACGNTQTSQTTKPETTQSTTEQTKTEATTGEPTQTKKAPKDIVIGFAAPYALHPAWAMMKEGALQVGKDTGCKVLWQGPADGDLQKTLETIEAFIAQKVDGIVILPLSVSAFVPITQKCKEAGIPVTMFGAGMDAEHQDLRIAWVGTDNEIAGRLQLEEAHKKLGVETHAKVGVILSSLDAPNQMAQVEAMRKYCSEHPGSEVVDVRDDGGAADTAKTMDTAAAMLRANPEINIMLNTHGAGASAIGAVVDEMDKRGKIIVSGYDDQPQNIDAVKQGSVFSLIITKVEAVTEAEIDSQMNEYSIHYDMATNDLAAVRYQAREEVAIKRFLENGQFGAFHTNFQDLQQLRQLPGLACQDLMRLGYGFAGEGDWKTAGMVRIMKLMAADMNSGTSFMEDYTYHLEPGNAMSMGAHMLEVCPTLAAGKAQIKVVPLGIGDREPPARLTFKASPGPAILVSLIDMGDRLRMIVNEVICQECFGVTLKTASSIGISAMMHGYLVFDKAGNLLTPFRTWRNNITGPASEALTRLFNYPIPQRWSIAHLYQSILNHEEHVDSIDHLTTLAGYIHWQLTDRKVLGIGEASGVFPIDLSINKFNTSLVGQFNQLISSADYPWKLEDILPEVLVAGDNGGTLTVEGASLLDISKQLKPGVPLCPPEGDAGTGMVATNSIGVRTGNVSAGTSVFAMIVLEKELSQVYPQIDLLATPDGHQVAMVHSNNCTSDYDAWISLFGEAVKAVGLDIPKSQLYEALLNLALKGEPDCGGLLSYGYISGEHITGFEEGRPLFVRSAKSHFNLANFMRVNLFT